MADRCRKARACDGDRRWRQGGADEALPGVASLTELVAAKARPLDQLGPQALAILATALRRAGLDACDPPFAADLVRYDDDLAPERIPVVVRERPPMITVPEYCAKFGREQTA